MDREVKHAYLILAHHELTLLKLLIKSLDDKRNDIYVHVDAKEKNFDPDSFKGLISFSDLIFVKRIKVYWGGISLTKATILLFKKAMSIKQYAYYHLISGVDIPLMTQNEIHDFIQSTGGDKEFIHIQPFCMQEKRKMLIKKLSGVKQKILFLFQYEASKFGSLYFFNEKYLNIYRTNFSSKMISFAGRICIVIQQLIGIERNKKLPIYHGSEWYSITHALAINIHFHEKWIEKHFNHCLASDEIFLPTLIKHFKLPVKIYEKEYMRHIDKVRGFPYIFRISDYDKLINCNCFFARKFSMSVDKEIIRKLYCRLLPEEVVDSIL